MEVEDEEAKTRDSCCAGASRVVAGGVRWLRSATIVVSRTAILVIGSDEVMMRLYKKHDLTKHMNW